MVSTHGERDYPYNFGSGDYCCTTHSYCRARTALHTSPTYYYYWASETLTDHDAALWAWEFLCSTSHH